LKQHLTQITYLPTAYKSVNNTASRYQEGRFHHAIPADGEASKELVAEGLGLGDGAEAAVDDLRQ
jgi:hypothetical protein